MFCGNKKIKVKEHLHLIGADHILDLSSRFGNTWAIYISGAGVNQFNACLPGQHRVPQLVKFKCQKMFMVNLNFLRIFNAGKIIFVAKLPLNCKFVVSL